MNKLFPLFFAITVITIFSCRKDYSYENGYGSGNGIIGANCRISQIVYSDSATAVAKGSIAASINANDTVSSITQFDSLANTILFYGSINYSPDTIFIDAYQYFVTDSITGHINRLHGLTDQTNPASAQFDADYLYDGSGHLVTKSYSLTSNPGMPYYVVTYTYTNGNLTHMTGTDLSTGNLITDADIVYSNIIFPTNYMYLFPDEQAYSYYNQFFNFGKKSTNALTNLKVRYYNPGNVVRDSTVSTFSTYNLSPDNYVLSVIMKGNDQSSIPALAGKLTFSYKCK